MTTSPMDSASSEQPRSQRRRWPVQTATLVLLAVVAVSGLIVAAWFSGEARISQIFAQLNALQHQPPIWLAVPMVMGEYLIAPTVILLVLVLIVTRVSPQPRPWSRTLVVGTLLILLGRYVLWRSLSTLNLSTPLNGTLSLGLLILELLMLLSSSIQLFLMLRVKDRRREADQSAVSVQSGAYQPTVDILIPTYNEPEFILRRTVIGCQALDYPAKTVYLLDDTHRPEIKALAASLGCTYLSRSHNTHAKAGNLNHALHQTQGELLVVFDADFVPTRNFLTRTIGFFQDPQVALVQTPQSFYNADPIARNLGLENVLTPEEEVFYRQIQPIRDGAGSVVCSGTSFVVRRSTLEQAGGFVTDSLSEDYFTGIRLSAQGYRLIYLDEKLSAGLAAENMAAHAAQRLRWARGTLQAFFIQTNPLTIRGLKLLQRLAHLEGLLHWFTSLSRIYFLLMPLAYSFLGVIPIRATVEEALFFFIPFYGVQITTFAWLNHRSRSALLSDVYSLVLAFPLAITVIQTLLHPFGRGFKVTPKGTASDRYTFNWILAAPLMVLFVATAVSLWRNLGMCLVKNLWSTTVPLDVALQAKGIGLGWIWSAYNLITLGVALLVLFDVPKPHLYEWFNLRRTARLRIGGQTYWGVTTMLSEAGAEVALTQALPQLTPGETPVELNILEANLALSGQVVQQGSAEGFPTVRIRFDPLKLDQQRPLIDMLYCRPGQWQNRQTPGEWQSLGLLFLALFRPRILQRQADQEIRTIAVAKV